MFLSFRDASSRNRVYQDQGSPDTVSSLFLMVFVSLLQFSFSNSTRLLRISALSKEWRSRYWKRIRNEFPRSVKINKISSLVWFLSALNCPSGPPTILLETVLTPHNMSLHLILDHHTPFTPPHGFRNTSGCPVLNRLHINARTSSACKVFRYYAVQQCSQLTQFRNMPRETAAGSLSIVSPTRFPYFRQLNSSFVIRQSVRRD